MCYVEDVVSITEVQWSTKLICTEGFICAILKYIVWGCKPLAGQLILKYEKNPFEVLQSTWCMLKGSVSDSPVRGCAGCFFLGFEGPYVTVSTGCK